MSDNEYVATAAAEKRLREVLADRLAGVCEEDRGGVTADNLTYILLDGAKIEYKPRTKTVLISLTLPDTAKPKPVADPVPSDGYPDKGSYDEAQLARVYSGEPVAEAKVLQPTPHIAPFAPVLNPDADYEDVHFE